MSQKIIILSSHTQSDGSYSISGVFWLTAPANAVVPNPGVMSRYQAATSEDTQNLKKGVIVESQFTSGLFPSGTSIEDARASLQEMFVERQASLDATSPPVTDLIGSSFNGVSWSPYAGDDAWLKALISQTNSDGIPLRAEAMRTGSELVMPTHNFCDKTTWYTTSERVEATVLTNSGDGLSWTSGDVILDMTHGKLFDEDALRADTAHGYAVIVTSDGSPMVERLPFATSGGDFYIDYLTGTFIFSSSQSGKTVSATYSRVLNSIFTLVPIPGTRIDIEKVKVQFSENVILHDSIIFEIWAYNPQDFPNKVKIAQTAYKTIENFMEESFEMGLKVPAFGGSSRGMNIALHTFKFAYRTIRTIASSLGVELRVRLENDVPCEGARGSATFYCTVREE